MDKKIKVVNIVNRFNIGGITTNVALLTRYLGDDFEVTLIGGNPEKGEADSLYLVEKYGIKPIILSSIQRDISFGADFKAFMEIRKILKEIKPDVVHTHASKAGVLGRLAALSLRVPVIVHTFHGHIFHSYFGRFKTWVFKSVERFLARKSSGIIAISDLQKHELSTVFKIVSPEKMKVIICGSDLDEFLENKEKDRQEVRAEYGIKDDEVAITIIGRLVPIKDHQYFLRVIKGILETTKTPIKVFIVGDGLERDTIQQTIDEMSVEYPDIFTMTSWIIDIPRFIHGMDILCLTSKNEGTPVSVIEALAAGIPVVATDVGGVRDVLEDNKSGFVIKRENIETYIEKLRLLIDDKDLRENFSVYGGESVVKKYSYHQLVENTGNYYKLLLNK